VDSAAPIAFPFEACQRLTAVGDVAASFRCLLGGEVAAEEAAAERALTTRLLEAFGRAATYLAGGMLAIEADEDARSLSLRTLLHQAGEARVWQLAGDLSWALDSAVARAVMTPSDRACLLRRLPGDARQTWEAIRDSPWSRVAVPECPRPGELSREELGVVRSAMDAFDSIGWALFPTDGGRAIVAATVGTPLAICDRMLDAADHGDGSESSSSDASGEASGLSSERRRRDGSDPDSLAERSDAETVSDADDSPDEDAQHLRACVWNLVGDAFWSEARDAITSIAVEVAAEIELEQTATPLRMRLRSIGTASSPGRRPRQHATERSQGAASLRQLRIPVRRHVKVLKTKPTPATRTRSCPPLSFPARSLDVVLQRADGIRSTWRSGTVSRPQDVSYRTLAERRRARGSALRATRRRLRLAVQRGVAAPRGRAPKRSFFTPPDLVVQPPTLPNLANAQLIFRGASDDRAWPSLAVPLSAAEALSEWHGKGARRIGWRSWTSSRR